MVDNTTYRHIVPIATSRGRAMRQLAAIATTLAVTLMAFASAAAAHARGCAYAHTTINSASRAQLRRAVLCLVNKERSARHLPTIVGNSRLDRSAQGWTDEMVSHRDFSHGADFSSRITAVGFDWSNVGENILSPVYRMVGTGVSNGAPASNERGTWTQDFGLWMGQHPASGNYGPAGGCPYNN